MDMQLSEVVSAYFRADRTSDADAVAACFSENAVVKDEQNVYVGRDAIRRWKAEASAKFSYTVAPFAIASAGHRMVVTSHLVGDFPGSPIDLRYFYVLEGDKIAELEIKP